MFIESSTLRLLQAHQHDLNALEAEHGTGPDYFEWYLGEPAEARRAFSNRPPSVTPPLCRTAFLRLGGLA